MIKIIAIGKKHEPWITDGVERYSKRLQGAWKIEWVLLPHSTLQGDRARQEESERIVTRLKATDYVVLLDERGMLLDSPALSQLLERQIDASRHIVLVIGGAYGVSDELHQRSDVIWSLSPLVFPHQLVRLLVAEQLYRGQAIAGNLPYHHE